MLSDRLASCMSVPSGTSLKWNPGKRNKLFGSDIFSLFPYFKTPENFLFSELNSISGLWDISKA